MEILSLRPTVKGTVWGGQTLHTDYGFPLDDAYKNTAEAWLLSCHKDGPCVVEGGEWDGKTLADAIAGTAENVLGTHNAGKPGFPVLIKLIDAAQKLSVQVHPDDAYARRVENENGKTEAWYVLDAKPGATLVYGVKKAVSKAEFAAAVENGTLSDYLNFVEVKPGDVAFIPAGMLHAIGEGILLAEVQQSSNTTYRVYDYDRRDKDGKKRELHVEKALDVAKLTVPAVDFAPLSAPRAVPGGSVTRLTACEFFDASLLETDGTIERAADETSFVSLLVLDGEGTLASGAQTVPLKKGASLFVPANHGAFTLTGKLRILETRT